MSLDMILCDDTDKNRGICQGNFVSSISEKAADGNIAENSLPIDIQLLVNLVGDNPETIDNLLKVFLKSADQGATRLIRAWKAHDMTAVGEIGHKLKTPALSIGAEKLGTICQSLEDMGKTENFSVVSKLIPEFQREKAC